MTRMGNALSESKAEKDLRDYLERCCQAVELPEGVKPYEILETPFAWNEHVERRMSGGRVILVKPVDIYGHYRVKTKP